MTCLLQILTALADNDFRLSHRCPKPRWRP